MRRFLKIFSQGGLQTYLWARCHLGSDPSRRGGGGGRETVGPAERTAVGKGERERERYQMTEHETQREDTKPTSLCSLVEYTHTKGDISRNEKQTIFPQHSCNIQLWCIGTLLLYSFAMSAFIQHTIVSFLHLAYERAILSIS